MEILFLIILIFNIINFVYLSDSKTITLSFYENTYVKNIYNVSLLNVKDAKIKSNPSKCFWPISIGKHPKLHSAFIFNFGRF